MLQSRERADYWDNQATQRIILSNSWELSSFFASAVSDTDVPAGRIQILDKQVVFSRGRRGQEFLSDVRENRIRQVDDASDASIRWNV